MTDVKKEENGLLKEKPEKDGHGHSHKHKKPEIVTFKTHLTTLAKICCVVYCYTIFKLCFAKDGFDFFTWHPFFMTIGYMFCMTAGFYVLNKNNTYLRKKTRGGFRVQIHFYILGVGYVLSLIGLYFVYTRKNLLNKEHFTSWHGFCGIIAILSNFIPIINGTVLHWEKELKGIIPSFPSKKITKFLHVGTGCLCYSAGAVALVLTPYTKWFVFRSSGSTFTFYLASLTVIFSLAWALYGPGVKLYNVIKEQVDKLRGVHKEE